MKKVFSILFAIALIMSASNCTKTTTPDPVIVVKPVPGSLEMNFKAMYANKPLIINKIYDYNGKKIMFEKLQFLDQRPTHTPRPPTQEMNVLPREPHWGAYLAKWRGEFGNGRAWPSASPMKSPRLSSLPHVDRGRIHARVVR